MSIESRSIEGVLTLRIRDRESNNALDLSTVADLRAVLAAARNDDSLRLITVVSGIDRVFSLGMNLEKLDEAPSVGVWESFAAISEYAELLIDLATMPVPTLAVVDGIAAAGGVELACVCDTVIGTSGASFSIAQLRKGVFPFLTSAVLVPRIGQSRFLHWALSGQSFPAKRLYELGLIHQLCKVDERARTVALFSERMLSFDAQTLRVGIAGLRAEAEGETRSRIRHALALFTLNCLALKEDGPR
jgi:enoyl-CoA hydratase/carnithine racemase